MSKTKPGPPAAGAIGAQRPADRAYAWIRARIFSAEFAPGSHLKEEELALKLGASRSPVRDALRRLAGEGLVVIERERGTYVASFSPEEVDEIFRLRSALEAYGASLAARRLGAEQFARLSSLADEMQRLAASDRPSDIDRFAIANNEFHRVILEAAGSPRLATMLGPLIDVPIMLLKHHNWRGQVDMKRSNIQHREIIDALVARDPIWARTCMHAHIISTRPRGEQPGAGPDSEAGLAPLEIL